MLQAQRMVLKSGVEVGLGQMPGIVGFRGQAEVGELEPPDELPLLPDGRAGRTPGEGRMDPHQAE